MLILWWKIRAYYKLKADCCSLNAGGALTNLYNTCPICYLLAMKVECEGNTYEFERPMLASKLLEQLSLSRETHLVVVNKKLVTEDHKIDKDDEVKLIRVVSGG
jgi:sulfur carrier protein ThiS